VEARAMTATVMDTISFFILFCLESERFAPTS
jgi:hypothetical protein